MTLLGRIFHTGRERETTGGRATGGLLIGTCVGAMLTAIAMGLSSPFVGIIAFPIALFIWAAGLFLLAAPGWWALHTLGARCQRAAMIYGGALTYAVCLAYVWLDGPHPFEPQVLWSLPMVGLAAIGVSVGWVVARFAYGPAKTS